VKVVLDRAVQQAQRQAEIVRAQQELLGVERRMTATGQKSLLDVLRREIEVALAQEALSDATAQVNRTSFVASQVNGGLLSRMGLE
jgi:outer membrane protein TolC